MLKEKYMVAFEVEATPEDTATMKKYLAQSVANEFNLSCVAGVSIRESDSFARLRIFLEREVPHRLKEHIPIEDCYITEDVIRSCVDALCEDSDVLFNYDSIDAFLCSTLKEMDLPVED